MITCICYLYFNYLYIYYYALLLFYWCTLYCTAFFCSSIMKLHLVCNSCLWNVLILTCFIFSCQLTCWTCETYICLGNSLSVKGNQKGDKSKLGWLIGLLEQNTCALPLYALYIYIYNNLWSASYTKVFPTTHLEFYKCTVICLTCQCSVSHF